MEGQTHQNGPWAGPQKELDKHPGYKGQSSTKVGGRWGGGRVREPDTVHPPLHFIGASLSQFRFSAYTPNLGRLCLPALFRPCLLHRCKACTHVVLAACGSHVRIAKRVTQVVQFLYLLQDPRVLSALQLLMQGASKLEPGFVGHMLLYIVYLYHDNEEP